jgi:hypothetical protein
VDIFLCGHVLCVDPARVGAQWRIDLARVDAAPPIADTFSETRIRVSEVLRRAYDERTTTNASGLRRFLSVDPILNAERC